MTGGILLTGGSSRRMGVDKATIAIGASTLARRLADALMVVAPLAVEVGRGATSLTTTREDPPGSGPLAAIAAGHATLVAQGLGQDDPCLVVACDLPWMRADVLSQLAAHPAPGTVLPVIGGRDQPLCARWSADDLHAVHAALEAGDRSLRRLPDRGRAMRLDDAWWGVNASCFCDVDTPADLARFAPPS